MVGIDAIKMSKPHMNEDVFGVAKIILKLRVNLDACIFPVCCHFEIKYNFLLEERKKKISFMKLIPFIHLDGLFS